MVIYKLIHLHVRTQALLTLWEIFKEQCCQYSAVARKAIAISAHIQRQSEQERNVTAVYSIGKGVVGALKAEFYS